ncbi:hypothetical protein OAR97_01125 [Arcobacteraceae bacterium]|nr:hypothetical protein [Arcobacteraceae bacterium]
MYNIIAYICLIISLILAFILLTDLLIHSFLSQNSSLILCAITLSLGQIYDRVKTKPISQAIKDYWKAKINKNNDDSQTYDEYKSKKK